MIKYLLLFVCVVNAYLIALKQNEEGIKYLKNKILNEISNIESPNYGKYMSIEEIDKITYVDSSIIKKWFDDNNMKCDIRSDSILCDDKYSSIKIPEYIMKYIDFIDNRTIIPRKKIIKKGQSNDVVAREVVTRIYNVSDINTENASVGAMEYMLQDGFSKKDLLISELYNGVANNPIKKIVGDMYTPDGESELDVQTMYWGVPNGELWYWVSEFWMYSWANQFYMTKDVPQVVSISWGWSEFDQCDVIVCNNITSQDYIRRTNNEFMKIAARGITIVVASGDAGSPGRTNEGCDSSYDKYGWHNMNAIFPGSSPWVLSVGATRIKDSNRTINYKTLACNNISGYYCSTGTDEVITNYNDVEWTSGSGFSYFTETPTWQKKNVEEYLNSVNTKPEQKYFNKNGRSYPDVVANGHNCLIHYGGWTTEDGTSCATPIIASLISHLNAYQLNRGKPVLGFVNVLLYKMYNDDPSTFNDIVVGDTSCTEAQCCGNNFGFVSAKGWDTPSGMGTLNVGRIKQYLYKHT